MSDSSDDSVVSVIAVHDPQCLNTAYSVLAVPAAKIINRQSCEKSSFITSSHDQPSVSSQDSQTSHQLCTTTEPQDPVKLKATTACSATDIQQKETAFIKASTDGTQTLTKDISNSNKKSRRRRRGKLSVISVKEEIIPEEAPGTKEYPVTYGSNHSNNEVKSTETVTPIQETRAQSSDITRKYNKEISNGSIGTIKDNLKYTATPNVNEVKESSTVEAGEMGNGLSSEKQKCAKVLRGRRKDNESKNSRARKSKSPSSDLEVINRSSIETTDSYSSAATLIATANAAVGRRSPKKSPRSIPRWGVKLRDVVSSDDESFVSAGFRTPKSTTPLLKRAVEQTSPSQRLMEFGKNIERGITEKFANRSPTTEPSSDPSKLQNKTNVEIQQYIKPSSESIGITLPEKLFSSLPKRCSKDATIETDSDSFAMFQNTELLYASIPKDFHLIDDNLSDDVFMSCIDLAANSPGIPARSQYKNSNAQHCSAKGVNQAKTPQKPTQQSVTEIDTVQKESVISPLLLSDHGCSKSTGNKQASEEFATSYSIVSSDTVTKSSRSLRSLKMSEFSKLVSIPRQATDNWYITKSQNRTKDKLGNKVNNENDKPKHSRGEQTAPKSKSMCPNPSCRSQSPESSNSSLNMFHPTPCEDQKSPSSQVQHQQKRSLTHVTQNNQPRKDSVLSNLKFQKSSQTESTGLSKKGTCNPSEGPKSTKKPSSPSIQMSPKERSPNSPNHSPCDGSPVVPKHGIKDGSLSPGIAKRIGSEASPSLIQQRETHDGTLYCTINKLEQLTSVTVQAQTSSSKDLETNNYACATAEEESSQIQDSPKASKQDKITMNIIKKKEHLRSTYDNVPDSDDSMAYFTGKNDPIFFEDNCVSEEIIATEQTPLHYKVEQPQKLGIEILKSPSQAKIQCVLLKRKKTDSCVADILMSGKESRKPESGKSLFMTFPNEAYQKNIHESEPMETEHDNGDEKTKINKQQMSQLNKETKPKPDDTKPIEHLAKRQIRRRNKKKCLEMESKGSVNSSSDVPLSPNPLKEHTTFTSSTSPIIEEAQLDTNKIAEIHKNESTVKLGGDPESTTNILIQDNPVNVISENCKSTSAKNESSMDRMTVIDTRVVLSDPLLSINLEKRDHVSPPSHSANNNFMGIAEEIEDRDDVDNTIVNDKSREVLVFEKSVLRRLSGFANIQGDFNELNDRLKCAFDRDASQTSDEFVDPNKSCLVVLDELCDMGEKFKKANEDAVFTNSVDQIQTTVKDEPKQQSIISDSEKYIPNSPDTVKKRPCIPCELQPNTSIVSLKPNDDLVIVDQPKRDSQKITEVINSYSDDVTQVTHSKMKNFQRPNTFTLIPNTSGIVLSDPYNSSDVEFYSPLPRFSADALIFPGIEEASTELMSGGNILHKMKEKTPTSEVLPWFTGLDGMASPPSYLNGSGPRSRMSPAITEHTESELDVSEQLDNVSISTDSMYADDEDDGSEMIFSKKYTEESGGECQVSYTFYNTAHDYDSDEFWAESSAADVNYKMLENSTNQASCTFKKARNEMQDIQRHLRDLRRQMEYLQDDVQTTVLTPAFSMGSSEWRPITD